jgi:23S rRNA pseudouridine1911/1915/1917 synthase
VQMLMDQGDVLVNGERRKPPEAARRRAIASPASRIPRRSRPRPEDIPLDVVYEDADLAVINKPAGMMVHAGSGQNADARSRERWSTRCSIASRSSPSTGGDLRPGIVHRLDKDTSGLIVVAKNDRAHAALGEMFASRQIARPTSRWCRRGGAAKREPSTPAWPATRCGARA